jgi:hypothetical protein
VSITGIGATASAIAAVTRGWWIAPLCRPAITWCASNPELTILADTRTAQGVRETYGVDSSRRTLYATRDWITRNPETTRKLAHAIRPRWFGCTVTRPGAQRQNPAWFRGDDREVFASAMRNSMAMFSGDGRMTAEGAKPSKRAGGVDREGAAGKSGCRANLYQRVYGYAVAVRTPRLALGVRQFFEQRLHCRLRLSESVQVVLKLAIQFHRLRGVSRERTIMSRTWTDATARPRRVLRARAGS